MDTDGVRPPRSNREPEKPGTDSQGRIGRLKQQMYSRATQPASRPRRELSQQERTTPGDWAEPKQKENAVPRKQRGFNMNIPAHAKKALPKWFFIGAAIVFVITAGVATTFLLSGSNVVTSNKIDIAINGPRTIDGGDVLELQIAIRNNNSAALELADLVITYPDGTRTPEGSGTTMKTQRIPLGQIEPGRTSNGTVRAVLFGRHGVREDITVAVEYRLAGSSALFVAEATHTVLVASGTLEMTLSTNRQAVAGQAMDMILTISSNAQTTVKDVVLRGSFPFGFEVTDTTPQQKSEGLWEVGDIAPGEQRTVRILGTLEGQTGDARVFRFLAGTRSTPSSSVVDVVLAEVEHEVAVTRPFLAMELSYDGVAADDYVARTGTTVPVLLKWRNTLDVALTDVVIAATLSGSGLDPFNVSVENGFYRSIDSVVLWDKTTTQGELASIPAGEEGQLQLRLLPSVADDLLSVENPTIKIELHAAGQRLSEDRVPETIQSTIREELRIASDVELTGRALYFENPLGSVGPLPPKVEHETTYGILWEVSNTTNVVRDTKVTAVLPRYVRWMGTVSPSAENVTFDANNRTVTWHVGKLLPDTGVGSRPPRRVIFAVRLVPSASQVGKTPALVQNQVLSGIDSFIEIPGKLEDKDKYTLSSSINDLTTKLTEAEFADIYGVIVP